MDGDIAPWVARPGRPLALNRVIIKLHALVHAISAHLCLTSHFQCLRTEITL